MLDTPDDHSIEHHCEATAGGIFAEVDLPINVSGLFYREMGVAWF
jgi:hypothetical protein